MHQCGIENVVANSGTALTKEQIHLLHRFTNNITLLYDGDEAGIHAAQRGTDMLLAAGMNVQILLLPDGDDPDSFARKHTANDFRQYVEEHKVDFLKFKTTLAMNQAQNDPRKLSQLVADIVTSISFIPDEITRTLYIRETAQMMQMQEQMIYRAVQNQMSKNREEEYKRRNTPVTVGDQQPEADPSLAADPSSVVEPSAQGLSDIDATPSALSTASVPPASSAREHAAPATELLLAQLIVRYGEKIICEAEDGEGNAVPLSVTEFIFYSLTQDGLAFAQPLAQVVLDKAMKHVHDEGFVAEKYFLSHRNQQLSQAAFQLCMDKEELSKYHSRDQQLVPDSSRLLELTTHVLADMKLSIVRQKINNIMADMKNPAMKSQQRELLVRFKEFKDAESRLAKECGDRVLK
jgi:DNA primase